MLKRRVLVIFWLTFILAWDSVFCSISLSWADITTGAYGLFPVVLTGRDVPSFIGASNNELAAYKWSGTQWQRVRLQVDPIFQIDTSVESRDLPDCPNQGVVSGREYRPDFTGTGEPSSLDPVDRAGLIDENDEISLLVADAGQQSSTDPVEVNGAPRYELKLTERNQSSQIVNTGYVYIYRKTGLGNSPSPEPITGTTQYAQPNFSPLCGSNVNQTTRITGSFYCAYYDTRWSLDDLIINPITCDNLGSKTAENPHDLLDRWKGHESRPGYETGDDAWGCTSHLLGEINGPVRHIRGVFGAKSGLTTTFYGYFYPRYIKFETRLRVHEIGGIVRIFDWNNNARGGTIVHRDTAGSGFTGQGVVDGNAANDQLPGHQMWQNGVEWWDLLATDLGSIFLFHRLLDDPTRFTNDPSVSSGKGFQFYYADQNTPLNEVAGHEETDSSLGNVGTYQDLITPPESAALGLSGTYCQPFRMVDYLRILPNRAAASDVDNLAYPDRTPIGTELTFRSGSGGDILPPAAPKNLRAQ